MELSSLGRKQQGKGFALKCDCISFRIDTTSQKFLDDVTLEDRFIYNPFNMFWLNPPIPDSRSPEWMSDIWRIVLNAERRWCVDDDIASPFVAADMTNEPDIGSSLSPAGC